MPYTPGAKRTGSGMKADGNQLGIELDRGISHRDGPMIPTPRSNRPVQIDDGQMKLSVAHRDAGGIPTGQKTGRECSVNFFVVKYHRELSV